MRERGRDPIEVVEYDPRWPVAFGAIAAPLRAALGDLALSIEHVGSTSVPGLAAKPIIDLDIVISSRLKLPEVLERLAGLSYVHRGNLGIPGREAFHWPGGQRHHLYVCSVDVPGLHEHLLFRDYLRAHAAEVQAYGALKQRLAAQHREDREAYTDAKTDFIRGVLARAAAEYGFEQFQPALEGTAHA